jgi:uncharacterized protein YndB with AHSA1/START domain
VVIERPPEEVFAYVSDAETLPERTGTIREVRKDEEIDWVKPSRNVEIGK